MRHDTFNAYTFHPNGILGTAQISPVSRNAAIDHSNCENARYSVGITSDDRLQFPTDNKIVDNK